MFENEIVSQALKTLYTSNRQVSVLLGGPPCQGFSRIGRGKIRSLREHGVHVQIDPEAGDIRNRLLFAYVRFVSALAPRTFLFENVRHFQVQVKTPEGIFLASQILAEAINDISNNELNYTIANRVVDASQHLIPQKRERFFMVGIRSDLLPDSTGNKLAQWCLSVPEQQTIPVKISLDGLPEPYFASETANGGSGGNDLSLLCRTTLQPGQISGSSAEYINWIRMPAPHNNTSSNELLIDSHHARPPRRDDGDFFELVGPGKRWMDYRCDDSPTLIQLSKLLNTISEAVNALQTSETIPDHPALKLLSNLNTDEIEKLAASMDGSLSLRLLLENIQPLHGEVQHHLLTPGYLQKKEGSHGDWLARLPANKPSKTIVSHMGKDTYSFIHPFEARTLSVREAARIQSFPDWFSFKMLSLVDAFRVVGNAVPPLLSNQLAARIAQVLWAADATQLRETTSVFSTIKSEPYSLILSSRATG